MERGAAVQVATYGCYLAKIHAGLAGAPASPSRATHYRIQRDLPHTLIVSLSQPGWTEETVATQALAARRDARTTAIINEVTNPLANVAGLTLRLAAGPELAGPVTRTYTAQLAAATVPADVLAEQFGLWPVLRRVPAELEWVWCPRSNSMMSSAGCS